MKKKVIKAIKWFLIGSILLIFIGLIFPTWTPKINLENSISELRKVEVNGTSLEIMIRGHNRNNPILIFVHGGPCCSEIPYVRKYQDLLEKDFTIVHYDQRGSGKSFNFGEDYSSVTTATHVEDLISLTKYIEGYLNQKEVILIGHSYGTYIGTIAVAKEPNLYNAYVGIGQKSNTIEGELNTLRKCINAANEKGNKADAEYLIGLDKSIEEGQLLVPRSYVRKYGFAARGINETEDYLKGFILGTEYNLLDTIRFIVGSIKHQEKLIMEAIKNPLSDIVKEINIPVYFVMGKYDGMTSPEAAEKYLDNLTGSPEKEIIIFEESAHYPQFEEEEEFYKWICEKFKK